MVFCSMDLRILLEAVDIWFGLFFWIKFVFRFIERLLRLFWFLDSELDFRLERFISFRKEFRILFLEKFLFCCELVVFIFEVEFLFLWDFLLSLGDSFRKKFSMLFLIDFLVGVSFLFSFFFGCEGIELDRSVLTFLIRLLWVILGLGGYRFFILVLVSFFILLEYWFVMVCL